jgi:hypothetical protein
MNIRQIGSDEASQERERVRQEQIERDRKEREMSSKDREKDVAERNAERKQQREVATESLKSGSVDLKEIASQGGSLGRKLEREIRRFEQTGRVSSWLAGETIKAEAAQNASQQSAFRQAVLDVVSTSQNPIELGAGPPFFQPLAREPRVDDDDGAAISTILPWELLPRNIGTSENPSWEIRVAAGTLNGILPSNYTSVFSANNTSTYFAKAVISTNGRDITGLSIVINNTPPTPQQAQLFSVSSNFEYLFGVFAAGQKQRTIGLGNIAISTRTWVVVQAQPQPQIGQSPYDIYFVLQ